MFQLHKTLAEDTQLVCSLGLSECLLSKDARFPWLILVPRVPNATELIDLDAAQTAQLWAEIALLSKVMLMQDGVQKLNVGALGNVVSQLHLHVVGRHPQDDAWPGPVWGHGSGIPYTPQTMAARLDQFRQRLAAG